MSENAITVAAQLGITLASIGLGFVGEPALAQLIRPVFTALPENWQGWVTHSAATVLAFALITFLHVVFGELIPKTLALQVPDRIALCWPGPCCCSPPSAGPSFT